MQKLFTQTFLTNKNITSYLFAGGFLFFAILVGIAVGTVHIPFMDIFQIIGSKLIPFSLRAEVDPMFSNIVMNIRLPRVLLAGLVGASLAIAGAAFQGLLRNPLEIGRAHV